MSDNKHRSTFFLKYLIMARYLALPILSIVLIQFVFIIIFPSERYIIDFVVKFFSFIFMIGFALNSFRESSSLIKKAWFFIICWGLIILLILILNQFQIHNIISGNQLPLQLLLSFANISIILSFIILGRSGEPVFKVRRQLYIIGLTVLSVLIIAYIINYHSISAINYEKNEPRIISADIIPIIISTFTTGFNLATFIITLEVFWIDIRKKEEKRKVVYVTLMMSVFISYIINIFYLTEMSPGVKVPVYVEISGTFAMLLIGLAAWYEVNIKNEIPADLKYSLFYVSRIERIIPVLSMIILMTVFYFYSYKINELLIRTSFFIFVPFILFLLLYEWYSYRSEDALISILSISPSGILITDRKLEKTYFVNDSLYKIFKSSAVPSDLVISHNTSQELKIKITQAIAAGTILDNLEAVFIRKGGTAFNAQCKIVPTKYYSYDVVISWIVDITERKKYENLILRQKYSAEIASLHKTELLNNLTNRLQSGYATMKPHPEGWSDFIFTGMNRVGRELFGFHEDQTGKRIKEVFPGISDRLIYRLFEVLNTGIAFRREIGYQKIGKIFLFLLFKASDDEVACLVDDITETKIKEKELVARERELRSLLANFPGMAYRCMDEKRLSMLFVSRGIVDLCGYMPKEILDEGSITWNDIICNEDRDMVLSTVGDALKNRENFHIEYRIISKDGRMKQVWERGSGVYDDSGIFMFIEGFIVDITKLKEAEAVLKENDLKEKEMEKARALGQMAGGIAHDLNNRLMGMMSFASLIDMKVKDQNIKKYTDGIQDSIKRSTELIESLLIFARQIVMNRSIISVHTMLHEVIKSLAAVLPPEVTVSTCFNAGKDTVKADFQQICRAVSDIVINARDAMPEGGVITIDTVNSKIDGGSLVDLTEGDAEREFIVIKISDSGPGIEKENLGRIFDPFFTTKPVGKGRGLGLSAVYGTIQAHKGAITVDSRPGEGTEFSIFLPVA